jgi:hypothetical protein
VRCAPHLALIQDCSGRVAGSRRGRTVEQQPLSRLFLGLRIDLTFPGCRLGRQLIEIVQRVVVLRRECPIIFPTKVVQEVEPLAVYGVEKTFIVAVSLVNEGNLLALGNACRSLRLRSGLPWRHLFVPRGRPDEMPKRRSR